MEQPRHDDLLVIVIEQHCLVKRQLCSALYALGDDHVLVRWLAHFRSNATQLVACIRSISKLRVVAVSLFL
jgi:hypothetical protein